MTDEAAFPYAKERAKMFEHHIKEFHNHPPNQYWPCPTDDCDGVMVFDYGMEGCHCSKCDRYDG